MQNLEICPFKLHLKTVHIWFVPKNYGHGLSLDCIKRTSTWASLCYLWTNVRGWGGVLGLQLYTFSKFNTIQTENYVYWPKIILYFKQNVWHCSVFSIYIQRLQKVLLWATKTFFFQKNQFVYINAEFYADSKLV
jgi:hypothetical protein